MPLQTGTKLGPYMILAQAGAGGMGEVYKAQDTRLKRTVAIKVLPSQFSADAEMKQRFDREAHTIASLNHPHICTLYDIGSQDGTHGDVDIALTENALPCTNTKEMVAIAGSLMRDDYSA